MRIRSLFPAALIALVACGDASIDTSATAETLGASIAPGVYYGVRSYNGREAHVVFIAYRGANVDFRTTDATNPNEAYSRVSDWASHFPDMAIALNGGIWDRAHDGNDCWQTMHGLNMRDHVMYTPDGQFQSYLLVKDGKDVHIQTDETLIDQPGPDWKAAVSANTVLVANGHTVPCNDPYICPELTSRTAIGLSHDKEQMWIVVTKTPMNLPELASFIVAKTAADSAVNLDGGGSSTLWVRGKGVVNIPASSQRTVCNHFGIVSH